MKKKPKSDAQRSKERRDRLKAQGKEKLELWPHPDDKEKIKKYAEKLALKRL